MLHVDVNADITAASALLSQLREKRAARAIMRSLSAVALEARDAVRQDMPHRFTLRRPWVQKGIGVEFARTTNLQAAVFSRDAFMRDQEYGGTRSGARSQTIALGRMAAIKSQRVIPKSLQPKALMAKKNVFYHGGTLFERRGTKSIQALYLFRKQVKIRPRFGMEATVRVTVLRSMSRVFNSVLHHELAGQ